MWDRVTYRYILNISIRHSVPIPYRGYMLMPADIDNLTIITHTENHFKAIEDEVVPEGEGWFSLDTRKLRVGDGLKTWKDIDPFCYNEDITIDVTGDTEDNSENKVFCTEAVQKLIEDLKKKLESLTSTVTTNKSTSDTEIAALKKLIEELTKTVESNKQDIENKHTTLNSKVDTQPKLKDNDYIKRGY